MFAHQLYHKCFSRRIYSNCVWQLLCKCNGRWKTSELGIMGYSGTGRLRQVASSLISPNRCIPDLFLTGQSRLLWERPHQVVPGSESSLPQHTHHSGWYQAWFTGRQRNNSKTRWKKFEAYFISSGTTNAERNPRREILGMFSPHAEGAQDGLRRGHQGSPVPASEEDQKQRMSITLREGDGISSTSLVLAMRIFQKVTSPLTGEDLLLLFSNPVSVLLSFIVIVLFLVICFQSTQRWQTNSFFFFFPLSLRSFAFLVLFLVFLFSSVLLSSNRVWDQM